MESQHIGQACLRQADARPQRQRQLTEGIVSLTIQGSVQERSPSRDPADYEVM